MRNRFLLVTTVLVATLTSASEQLYTNSFEDADALAPLYGRFGLVEVRDGGLRVEHEFGHSASPTLPVRFKDAVVSFRFRLEDAERFVCRFEDESRVKNAHSHLCRIEIGPNEATLRLDQPPKDRELRAKTVFASHRQNFADGEWHEINLIFKGDSLIATIDGDTRLEARHEHLGHEKVGLYFVVQKGVAWIDDLNVSATTASSDATQPVEQASPQDKPSDAATVRGLKIFHEQIEPLFAEHCYGCHSHEYEEASGGLVLDSRAAILTGGDLGPSLLPGEPDKSLLLEALVYENAALQMPPDGKLDESLVEAVRQWIELGAPDPRKSISEHQPTASGPDASKLWSVQPLADARLPAVADSDWPCGRVDQFVLARLEAAELGPSPDADAVTLVRRLHYVLTGLPPTIEEVDEFVDTCENGLELALATHVDELLARPQFGERWGRHWLDVARYADASGTTAPRPFKQAWRYRDYVIHSFNVDKPWDQFVREQIAGDLLDTGSPVKRAEGLIATGFLALSHVLAATRDPETLKLDTIDEQLDVIGKSFLGISIGCARCHDHKLDPFPTRDYYAMAGVFRSTQSFKPSGSQESIVLDGAELNLGSNEALPSWMVGDKKTRLHSVSDASRPRDEPIHLRGEVEMTGDVVPRGFPTLISTVTNPAIPNASSGREQLADWILSEQNALTSRVIVNRIWQHVFGHGLVRSTDNFGFTGDPPSHPELLDDLAARFRTEHHDSFKSMIRELLLSRTWRQASTVRSSAFTADPQNRLLWRANPRRMDAESLVDAIQFVSGRLDLSSPGGTVPEFRVGNQGTTSNLEIPDDVLHRRAVYWPVFRKDVPIAMDVLGIFNFPPATAPRGTREVTNVPAQSLALLNNPFLIDCARAMSKSLLADESLTDDAARLRTVYQTLYGRDPAATEEARGLSFLESFAADLVSTGAARPEKVASVCWNRLCHTLMVSNEFIVIP